MAGLRVSCKITRSLVQGKKFRAEVAAVNGRLVKAEKDLAAEMGLAQRWYFRFPCHVGGLVGLVALLIAVRSLDLEVPAWMYVLIGFGILIEFSALGSRAS
jgi:hypothetical protein